MKDKYHQKYAGKTKYTGIRNKQDTQIIDIQKGNTEEDGFEENETNKDTNVLRETKLLS